MRPGRYAAADGSLGRSAGAAMGRGVLLLALALVIGVVLLNATDEEPPGTTVSSSSRQQGESAGGDGATTTTAAPTTTVAPLRAPKDVKVIVANASEVKGAAGRASEVLKTAGYNALAPTNATATPASAVYFTGGFDREAAALASALQLPGTAVKALPSPSPVPDLKTANVLVVLGADAASRFAATGTTAGATTTTAPAAAATTTTTVKR